MFKWFIIGVLAAVTSRPCPYRPRDCVEYLDSAGRIVGREIQSPMNKNQWEFQPQPQRQFVNPAPTAGRGGR